MRDFVKGAASLAALASTAARRPTVAYGLDDPMTDSDAAQPTRYGDLKIMYLCRLHHALCAALETGQLKHGDAIEIFDRARSRIAADEPPLTC
jgi:hypothetical protein